jgi:hypothetical protein
LLSPFGNIDGLYFDGSDEKNNFTYEFQKDLAEISKDMGIQYIKMDFDSENDFYTALMEMQEYATENTKLYGTSKDGHFEVVIESEKSDDDDEDEEATTTTTTKRKKKKSEDVEDIDIDDIEE